MALQDHVHLALTLGGSPEFAPIYKWKITDYIEEPEVIISVKRTSKAKLRVHTIDNESGPIQLMNFKLTIKIIDDETYSARQYLAFLKAMNGRNCYYVDIDHSADGADHTNDVKLVEVQINRMKPQSTMLNYYLIDIDLLDNYTVS